MAAKSTNDEVAILGRVIMPDESDMNADRARAILELKFSQQDITRMHELTVKNQDDELTPAEQGEIAGYMRVGHFLELMHSKARLWLKKQNGAN